MATRRSQPQQPQRAQLNVQQMTSGITRIERLIADIENWDVNQIQVRFGPEVNALETRIKGVLDSVFGSGTVEYSRYQGAINLDNGPVQMATPSWIGARSGRGGDAWGVDNEAAEGRRYVSDGKVRVVSILREAVTWLKDEIEASGVAAPALLEAVPPVRAERSRKVFIVHGHDGVAKHAVARFVESLDLDAVILHEQANEGRTIIEKVEAYGDDVGFAIVLLTPDDDGCKKGGELRSRPRQNVIMELGYFIGKLSRKHVCALKTDVDIELPSDILGVVYQTFEPDSHDWKMALGKELRAAGYKIDFNKVME